MIDPRTPCLIGGAQRTIRPGKGPCPEPLVLWDEVTRAAAADALPSAAAKVLESIDSLQIVYCMAWPSQGRQPRHRLTAATCRQNYASHVRNDAAA